jgi:5-methyltetrahydrofolate--homocysteine methyltransferase
MFILLPLTGGEVPQTAEKRQKIIKNIFQKAKIFGFTKDDFIVDCLVMAVASNPSAAQETLKTLHWCAHTFKSKTIFGLSNVSFGMPGRPWLNATFLAMAQFCGLTMAIANPASQEMMNIKITGDVLLSRDKDALRFIKHFSAQINANSVTAAIKTVTPQEKIADAIMNGDRENILPLIEKVLSTGVSAQDLVDKIMIPSIVRVGDLYEKKIYFLPQLMSAAEAMKKALAYLEPHLKKGSAGNKGKIILATVKGDIHDIGKNIVALLLRNYGYYVIDLGKDVAAETIIAKAKEENSDVIALSALMTTTMVNMKDVITLARANGIQKPFMIGGAVVTEAYAKSIGASFARDGVEAVKIVERLIKK